MFTIAGALGAAIFLLALPALSHPIGERTGINDPIALSPSTPDFVREALIIDMFEIEAGRLAQKKGDPVTKEFAAQMIADHTNASAELKSLLRKVKLDAEAPRRLNETHQIKLDKLKELDGPDFNKEYLNDQVSIHRDAILLFQRYAKDGENRTLKTWANTTVRELQQHRTLAQYLSKQHAGWSPQMPLERRAQR